MRLLEFSVKNYKVFKDEFSIKFAKESIAILTGRNNTGKSTLLEAINRFYLVETKAKTITNDCFSNKDSNMGAEKEIILTAKFEGYFNGEEQEEITFIKKYKSEQSPKFYDIEGCEIKSTHPLKEKLELILSNQPYYITPYMNPEDINELIQNIYSEILKTNLENLEKMDDVSDEEKNLADEYKQIKQAYPSFLKKIKGSTDGALNKVSDDVSNNLQKLFSNESLKLNVKGGESSGFSVSDLLKSTNSSVNISNNLQNEMPLSNQGTGLQRISLIYLIQNMIEKNLMGERNEKLLLIDEPEAFLHPEAVRALSKSLYSIGGKMPLMVSSHSPILIDLSEKHTSIQVFRVNQTQSKTAINLYQSSKDKFEKNDIENMKILNYVDSYVNEFFFADKIFIVEGDTEYLAFKYLAKKENVNIHIIRARGKGTIQTLMKILNQFNADYYVLHDVDNDDSFSAKTLKAQKTMCENIVNLMKKNLSTTTVEGKIFVSETTFETAIGIGKLSNSMKTKRAYEIVNYTEGNQEGVTEEILEQNRIAFEKIKSLFDYVFKEINNYTFNNSGFHKIVNEEDYNSLFDSLIAKKEMYEVKTTD